MNWYRAMDRNHTLTARLQQIQQPCAFIGGTKDGVLALLGGQRGATVDLEQANAAGPSPVDITWVDGAGHFIH